MTEREVAEASRIAYRKMVLSGKAINLDTRIYKWLGRFTRPATHKKGANGFTRNEIAEYMQLRLGTVCGRIRALILSDLAEELSDKRDDRFTKETASVVVISDPDRPITRWYPDQARFDL